LLPAGRFILTIFQQRRGDEFSGSVLIPLSGIISTSRIDRWYGGVMVSEQNSHRFTIKAESAFSNYRVIMSRSPKVTVEGI